MNTVSRIFFDASFLLEIIMARKKQLACVEALKSVDGTFCISALTPHICYYFREKYKLDRDPIDDLLVGFDILPIDQTMIRLAQKRYGGKDFEDCLQAVSAESGGCDEILTLDNDFAKDSRTKLKVRVI